jgi:predicted permease
VFPFPRKGERGKYVPPFFILSFSPFSSLGPILCVSGFGRENSTQQGKYLNLTDFLMPIVLTPLNALFFHLSYFSCYEILVEYLVAIFLGLS